MAKIRRITLRILETWDTVHKEHTVREIEMKVEGALIQTAYSLQFWDDVRTYGLEEAFLYLERTDTGIARKDRLPPIKEYINRLCTRIRAF